MKTLFITGGHGEIGQAIVKNFSDNNYNIVAPASRELDCSDNRSIEIYFDTFSAPIHAFVHCAGINNPKAFMDITPETIQKTFQINTLSFLYLIQRLSNHFDASDARIVAVSSIYGSVARSKRLEYSTSKHALKAMIQTLALELAPRKILINAVSPGFIATKLTYKNNTPEVIANLIADVPLQKLGAPEDVANLIYFLCSEKNSFLTGQDIIIDGGYLAGGFQPNPL